MRTEIAFSSLLPPKDNPRRTLDHSGIAGLARSIRTDGLLQNLVVRPEGDGRYRVISGKRRYLAFQLLKKQGDIKGDYQVPVEIKDELAEGDALRLATVENVQREPLHPMDEAEAFAKLLQAGGTVEAIVEKTGLSAATVKRRLALASLCAEAKKALRAGTITRAVAEALTLGSREQQRSILASLESEGAPEPEDIREMLLEQKPTVAMAVFARERYTGTITTDLFADEETSYFDDADQFLALQREAVEALAEEHRRTAAWVEVLHAYAAPWWQYREAQAEEPSGVAINLHPSGAVEVREGLARHEVKAEVVEAVRESPLAPRPQRERPAFNAPLLRYVALQKSAAVQAALLRNPRKAKEVATLLLLLGLRIDVGVRLSIHPCLSAPASERGAQRCYREIDEHAALLADRLGLGASNGSSPDGDGRARLLSGRAASGLHEAIGRLSDEDLDRLMVLLPVLCFGQEDPERLDAGDSLFNAVAAGIGVEMREWWTPDAVFLSALRRDQVLAVAAESGASEHLQGLAGRSKKDAVEELARYFSAASAAGEEHRTARQWLPGLFRFPSVGNLGSEASAT